MYPVNTQTLFLIIHKREEGEEKKIKKSVGKGEKRGGEGEIKKMNLFDARNARKC